MNREDFTMLTKNVIYFDNGATTLKPKVLEKPSQNTIMNIVLMPIEGIMTLVSKLITLMKKLEPQFKTLFMPNLIKKSYSQVEQPIP